MVCSGSSKRICVLVLPCAAFVQLLGCCVTAGEEYHSMEGRCSGCAVVVQSVGDQSRRRYFVCQSENMALCSCCSSVVVRLFCSGCAVVVQMLCSASKTKAGPGTLHVKNRFCLVQWLCSCCAIVVQSLLSYCAVFAESIGDQSRCRHIACEEKSHCVVVVQLLCTCCALVVQSL